MIYIENGEPDDNFINNYNKTWNHSEYKSIRMNGKFYIPKFINNNLITI
jgi:hypothetical protein